MQPEEIEVREYAVFGVRARAERPGFERGPLRAMIGFQTVAIVAAEHREAIGQRRLSFARKRQARDHRRNARRCRIAPIERDVAGDSDQRAARRLGADHRRERFHRLVIVPGRRFRRLVLLSERAPHVEDVRRRCPRGAIGLRRGWWLRGSQAWEKGQEGRGEPERSEHVRVRGSKRGATDESADQARCVELGEIDHGAP